MQVSDLYFRLKLLTFGFLCPVFIYLGLLLSSPYWLKVSSPFHKSDVAVLETNPFPSKKFLKSVAILFQKQTFSKLILVIREDKSDNALFSVQERETKLISYLATLNLPQTSVQVLKISPSKLGDTDEVAKNVLKIAVSENLKSILILAREYESKRMLKIYQKNLASLPLQISAYPFASENTPSNWFLSEEGFREVSLEFLKYIYSAVRGVI
ncbi:hypothetical protein [Leptospira idonii]|uniref:DUF218 domain-containing protein n=1 Tax=Leptospira idonii TaxID=1193500 RepID=A0A4V3JXZ0_9LEPT|nr:hypothetical protein [Leptospira idonii]TGN18416.1 hypothetical protein EHS15_13540 [Leptospira idonii]